MYSPKGYESTESNEQLLFGRVDSSGEFTVLKHSYLIKSVHDKSVISYF